MVFSVTPSLCVDVWLTICPHVVKFSGHFFVISLDLKVACDIVNHSSFFKCILLLLSETPYFLGFPPGSFLPVSSPTLCLTSIHGMFYSLVVDSIYSSVFIVSLGDLIRSFGFKHHPNADDLRFLFPSLAVLPSFGLLSSAVNLTLILGHLIGLSNFKCPKQYFDLLASKSCLSLLYWVPICELALDYILSLYLNQVSTHSSCSDLS